MLRIFLFSLIFLVTSCASKKNKPNDLAAFSTDGCSLYPDGIPLIEPNHWVHCCLAHDIVYWAGGEEREREEADKELGRCVGEKSFALHAVVVREGAHIGGGANNILPWAWGFGWKQNQGYSKLTPKQISQIEFKTSTIIPAIRDYDSILTENQLKYILEGYQKFVKKLDTTPELNSSSL